MANYDGHFLTGGTRAFENRGLFSLRDPINKRGPQLDTNLQTFVYNKEQTRDCSGSQLLAGKVRVGRGQLVICGEKRAGGKDQLDKNCRPQERETGESQVIAIFLPLSPLEKTGV